MTTWIYDKTEAWIRKWQWGASNRRLVSMVSITNSIFFPPNNGDEGNSYEYTNLYSRETWALGAKVGSKLWDKGIRKLTAEVEPMDVW